MSGLRGNRDRCAPTAVDERRPLGNNAPLDIAIYAGPGWELWSPADIERRGLGGSETAVVRLAEALSAQGHAVEVYAEVKPCEHGPVSFPAPWFDPGERRDAVIVSRRPEILQKEINAAVTLFWMHDVDQGELLTVT